MMWRQNALVIAFSITIVGMVVTIFVIGNRQGWFEHKNTYTLTATKAAGVRPGIGVEYSGFEVGRVSRVYLSSKGALEMDVQIAREHQQWIRSDSVFALDQPLLGSPRIIVETSNQNAPLLPPGSLRPLRTDRQMDALISRGTGTLDEIHTLVAGLARPDGAFQKTLVNAEQISQRASRDGAISAVLDAKNLRGVTSLLEKSALAVVQLEKTLASVHSASEGAVALTRSADLAVQEASRRIVGNGGTADHMDAVLIQSLNVLTDLRSNLAQLDKTLANVTSVSADAAKSATGLDELRSHIDAVARNVDEMTQQLRGWAIFRQGRSNELP